MFVLPAALLLAMAGCNKFLDVMPTGKTVTPTVFADMKGMRSAVAGMYYKVYKLYTSNYYVYPDIADDIVLLSTDANTTLRQFYDHDLPSSTSGFWATIYELLVNVNNIIEYQPALVASNPSSRAELEKIMGEALFMRALCHFGLCNAYSQSYNYTADASHPGIPIVLRAPNYDIKPSRGDVRSVYRQVLTDLDNAEQLLADKEPAGKYYAGLTAVWALKSRVYLYMGDWESCITYSGKVIDEVPLARGDDYVSMFTRLANNETEVIFRLNGELNQATTLITLHQITETNDDGKQSILPAKSAPSAKLLGMFGGDATDLRYGSLISSVTETATGAVYWATNKFNVSDNTNPEYAHFNPIVFRCSEMYLNRAEAYLMENQLSDAAADVKAIIARAHGKGVDEVTVDESDADALLALIRDERVRELCFEGHKLFDTNRWKQDMVRDDGTNSLVRRLDYPSDYYVLPIPRREIDINPHIVANPSVNDL